VSVGSELSRARQERRLSVEDVAADTRIRSTLIRAIEDDNFDLCGGSVYARGHIRSIARVVGTDPVPLLAEFDRGHEGAAPAALTLAAAPTDHQAVARSERHGPNWAAAMVAVLVIVIAAALVPFIMNHHGSGAPSSNAATSPPVHHSASPSPSPSTTASPPRSATAQLNTAQASLLIRTTHSTTWMSVTAIAGNHKVLFEGLLPAGHQKLFTSKHGLAFTIGNAPAVDVVVNGHDIGSPPSSGNVSRGTVAPGADTVQAA
jgi:cytoskeleton protein RodZ